MEQLFGATFVAVMKLTKTAGIAFQLIGFAFVIGAILRLMAGFSPTALVLIVLGALMAWEGGKIVRTAQGRNNN